jgi:hypothetical protein
MSAPDTNRSLAVFTGAHPASIQEFSGLVESLAARIEAAWDRTLAGILEMAKLCQEAKTSLTWEERKELYNRLPFHRTQFEKLAAVGLHPRLQNPTLKTRLPPHYSTLYELCDLNDQEFDKAVAENVIHPKAKRADIINWKREQRGEPKKAPVPKLPKSFAFRIRLPSDVALADWEQLRDQILTVCEEFGAELVVRDPTPETSGREL